MTIRSTESMDEGRITFETTGKQDPVCGMIVDPSKSTTANAEYGGVGYFFCSNECKEQFLRAPVQFAVTQP
jgi:YHS domain-containing protein